MNKILQFILLGTFVLSFHYVNSQEWKWAKGFGESIEASKIKEMAKISNNEIAVLGFTQKQSLFGETGSNPFVSIVDIKGNLKNSIIFDGNEEAIPMAIATDKNDNIYIIGNFYSVVFKVGNDSIYNKGRSDGFILKLDKNLKILWAKSIATTFEDLLFDITVDSKDNVYVAGYTITQIGSTSNTYETFLIKLSPESDIIWEKRGTTNQLTTTKSILIDQEDNCYWVGKGDSIYFKDGNSLLSSSEVKGGFIIKISPDSLWLNNIITSSIEGAYLEYHNLYIIQTKVNNPTYAINTIKYNLEFEKIWQKDLNYFYPLNYSYNGNVIKVTIDTEENIYLAGAIIAGDFEFANDTFIGINLSNIISYHSNIYLLKYNKEGEEVWAKRIGNIRKFYNQPTGILAYGNDELILSGNFQSDTLEFGEHNLYNNNSIDTIYLWHGNIVELKKSNAFFASFGQTNTRISEQKTFKTNLYPNPVHDAFTLVLPKSNFKKGKVDISNINGTLLKSQTIHSGENLVRIKCNDLPIGLHLIYIKIDDQFSIQKIVKQ